LYIRTYLLKVRHIYIYFMKQLSFQKKAFCDFSNSSLTSKPTFTLQGTYCI
jgi:hypothetical protein